MKRLLIILAITPLLFTSCTKDPYADYISSTMIAEVGEPVSFTNRSHDANSYEWDFNDGYYSTTLNASHSWRAPDIYRVSLSAFGEDGRIDVALSDIDVRYLSFTNLEITVEEYEDPYYLVRDISVRLYPSVLDWEEEVNMIAEGYTDEFGIVTFSNVAMPFSRRLYVDVWGPYHDNYQLAAEDAVWIETDVLVPDSWNSFIAVVDYYPEGKKAAINRKDLKKMNKEEAIGKESRIPVERKNLDKGNQTVR
ncbi:MAG: PKD domain-containing protein [Bacteroidales bacterium]|nr:PKD domain-containing protein [Bacteroidales bacterium]